MRPKKKQCPELAVLWKFKELPNTEGSSVPVNFYGRIFALWVQKKLEKIGKCCFK
jgi:hypothetical protein